MQAQQQKLLVREMMAFQKTGSPTRRQMQHKLHSEAWRRKTEILTYQQLQERLEEKTISRSSFGGNRSSSSPSKAAAGRTATRRSKVTVLVRQGMQIQTTDGGLCGGGGSAERMPQ